MSKKYKKTIFIDMDETLIHTIFGKEEIKKFDLFNPSNITIRKNFFHSKLTDLENKGDGEQEDFFCILRPYVYEFLDICLKIFDHVVIYSAGTEKYVKIIINYLFKNLNNQENIYKNSNSNYYSECRAECYPNCYPSKILTRNDCFILKGNYIKPLNKYFKKFDTNYKNCIIIDDNETTFVKNINNAFHIPKYEPESLEEYKNNKDDNLLKIINFFNTKEFLNCKDYRKLNKNIF